MKKFFMVILILFLVFFASIAESDFGNFSGNNDYGGNSGGGSRGGGSSRGSGYSGGGTISYGSNYDSGYRENFGFVPIAASTGFLDSPEAGVMIYIFAFILIGILISAGKKRKRLEHEAFNNRNKNIENINEFENNLNSDLNSISEYKNLDPEFDEGKLKSQISNLYIQMQDSWTAKNLENLRPYFTDEFYNQMNRQLESFKRTQRTDYTDRIAVLDVKLKGYKQSGEMDYIIAGLKSRIVSYILDDKTGKLVSGDMNKERFMEYEIELSRKSGTITNKTDGVKMTSCPHCGAPLNLNASAKCVYCGSVVTASNSEWAVCEMKGISQRTV